MRGSPHWIVKALRAERRLQGISQSKIGEIAGYAPTHISALETGHQGARIEIICDLAEALGLEIKLVERSNDK